MSRVPGERAPVSAPSSASLLTPAARDARPRALEAITGATPGVLGVQPFNNTKRVARNSMPLFEF